MSSSTDITTRPARELAALLQTGQVSAAEVMVAYLDRIEQFNPVVNAIVAPLPRAEALALARAADQRRLAGEPLGPLHGLPTAVKDLMAVKGFPTTQGSAALAGAPPATKDCLLARRLRERGALIIGKTNTPEFGLGVLSFNPVYGTTLNPYDTSRHAGGSSGGAAAALAARLLPIADGSDSGGSLRYPAAFCNVVGVRPTAGRVPSSRTGDVWNPHGVLGPMARDARDAAFFLAGLMGPSELAPLSALADPGPLTPLAVPPLSGLRLAWSDNLGGLPVDPAVRTVHAALRSALVAAGAVVDQVEPDFTGADQAWLAIEQFGFFTDVRHLVESGHTAFRADLWRNVMAGAALSARQLADALDRRTEVFREMAGLLLSYDAFIAPATPVPAPPAQVEWVDQVDGTRFERYYQWQMMANRLTVASHPVVVTGAGFTPEGWPVGIQVVGPHAQEAKALAVAAAIEDLTGTRAVRPQEGAWL
ncbi:MAG: hypothetical protein LBR19_01690 [Bifidobacteriaceae bacterium]|jgi:amidase|nr:hypothetical protein [Bifidobacteriaceae bacterium]